MLYGTIPPRRGPIEVNVVSHEFHFHQEAACKSPLACIYSAKSIRARDSLSHSYLQTIISATSSRHFTSLRVHNLKFQQITCVIC
jgi:hypothetical protein